MNMAEFLNNNRESIIKSMRDTMEQQVSRMKFTFHQDGEENDGTGIFSPVIEHDWQERIKPVFSEPWFYSIWDEPLLVDGDEVYLEIDNWKTRTVQNIRRVKDAEDI